MLDTQNMIVLFVLFRMQIHVVACQEFCFRNSSLQNRRQKVFNRGALRFCGGALGLCGGSLTLKIYKNSTAL